MKNFFSKFQKITSLVSLIIFILVISTGVLQNCVCAENNTQPSSQCENDNNCCCGTENSNEPAMTPSSDSSFITYIQVGCSCNSKSLPVNSLDEYMNSSGIDIAAKEFSSIYNLGDKINLSSMNLSRHENHSQELCINGISITTLKTTVLLT
ncbi:hypothetical protein ACFL2X_00600 [Candidatus Latescibacterota bacterium]